MNGLNTMMQELQRNLIKDINTSKLPVGIVYFVLKDIFNETEKSYIDAINTEKSISSIGEEETLEKSTETEEVIEKNED